MTNVSERLFAATLAVVLLLFALVGCGGSGNESPESGHETETESGTQAATGREPLSTIHINIGTDAKAPETDDPGDEESGVKLPLTLDMGTDYIDKFTFLCDFSIYGLKPHSMLSDGRNTDSVITGQGGSFYVMAEDQLVYSQEYGGLLTVDDFISRRRPEYLLVALGLSDITTGSAPRHDDFGAAYAALLERLKEASPKTIIICLSILPGSDGSGLSVYGAERYNARILSAAEDAGVYYLDAASAFAASNGYLRPDCDGGSSRLSTTGLKKLLDMIRTHYAGPEN